MQRYKASASFSPDQLDTIKQKVLEWVNRSGTFLFLDSNHYRTGYDRYDMLAGAGTIDDAVQDLAGLSEAITDKQDWYFGHLCYDLKNRIEPTLSSLHKGHFDFGNLHFFRPETVFYIASSANEVVLESAVDNAATLLQQVLNADVAVQSSLPPVSFQKKISKEDYLNHVENIRRHIARGDCYELNYCTESFCEQATIDPLASFRALNKISPNPFAAFYRHNNSYLCCASPERFLFKKENEMIAQPIKGTIGRGNDPESDSELKEQLASSEKDKAENVMIVDLMRNDLARCCEAGSIEVKELFGIYAFPQVYQMISTVKGKLHGSKNIADALKASFPMGSMTGAPKVKVMELIEQYEASRRELFSGSVGYIDPSGNADFNVVIRSLFYNASSGYLSFQSGGAITFDSDPEAEWEEMLLKAKAMEMIFS